MSEETTGATPPEVEVDEVTGEPIPRGEANRDDVPASSGKRRKRRTREEMEAARAAGLEPPAKGSTRGRPRSASTQAKEAAGFLWMGAGFAVSLGAPVAGQVMQVQSPQAGEALAETAAKQFPRFYEFLNKSGGGFAMAPFIIAPVLSQVYANSYADAITRANAGDLSGVQRLQSLANLIGQMGGQEVYNALNNQMPVPYVQGSQNGSPPPPPPEAGSHDEVRRNAGGVPDADEAWANL